MYYFSLIQSIQFNIQYLQPLNMFIALVRLLTHRTYIFMFNLEISWIIFTCYVKLPWHCFNFKNNIVTDYIMMFFLYHWSISKCAPILSLLGTNFLYFLYWCVSCFFRPYFHNYSCPWFVGHLFEMFNSVCASLY